MIYTYHHIKTKVKNNITITPFRFFLDMVGLIGKKVVYLDDYNPDDSKNVVLTFDDGYKSFLKYAFPILRFFKYPFEICVCSDFVNDHGYYLSCEDLRYLVKNGAHLQYHSKSHKDLTTLNSDDEIIAEITCPVYLKELDKNSFKFFAYPYWNTNEHIAKLVTKNGYIVGLSGDGRTRNLPNTWYRIRKG